MVDFEPLIESLKCYQRIAVAGGPRCGKSTIAVRTGERYQLPVRHADSVIGDLEVENFPYRERWSEASRRVSEWLREPGPWIIEGVCVPRALRKLLAATSEPLDMTVLWMGEPIQVQTDRQCAMHKGCVTVWDKIESELKARGAVILNSPSKSLNGASEQPQAARMATEKRQEVSLPAIGYQKLIV